VTPTTFPSLPSTGEHPVVDLRPGAPQPLRPSTLRWPDPPAPSLPTSPAPSAPDQPSGSSDRSSTN
jgi:hypothetical protein